MASLRIYEDQENQKPEQGRSKMNAMLNGGNLNQKRSVLGVIDGNRNENNGQGLKVKQPLGESKISNLPNYMQKKENWNSQKENNRKNIVNPIIPVAQFEAFKVYEDEEKLAKIEERLKAKSTSNVYKGTAEDRFFTKTEVAELERKGIIPSSKNEPVPSPIPSPMSIEKAYENEFTEEVVFRRTEKSKDDFFNMEEYSVDIYRYLREHELRNRAKAGYMKKQPDVTANMRSILVDWLVEVAEEYKLHTETLYLAVNYIDRFLSYMSVVRAKLQLVGTAAMFIASKYEEIYPPDIAEFVYITDDTYTKRQVIRMEHLIVKVLGFDLSVPTPLTFITSMCSMNKLEEKTKFLAMFLCELTLLEGETYLEYIPSTLAASAIALARHTLELTPCWPQSFTETTMYTLDQLQPCLEFLQRAFCKAATSPQHAIQDKYKSQKFLHISQVPPRVDPWIFAKEV
ncbi:cyclin-A2 isoform X2 [Sitophilus oryzae]|nr:cyclin-A2 isoform X2 [Sitophilus oryzae]